LGPDPNLSLLLHFVEKFENNKVKHVFKVSLILGTYMYNVLSFHRFLKFASTKKHPDS
jgi:hypothetical protein